jgi:septal ring factor EnvC (AmiA/AmiB activator)
MVDESKVANNDVEILKIKYSFFKFILGTFAISVLSLAINWQIQEKKLQFEIQTKESEYIAKFLDHGLDKELEKRRDFAAYFVRLSPSDDARLRWQGYLDFIEDLIKKAKEAEKIITEKAAALKAANDEVVLAQQQAEEVHKEIKRLSTSGSGNQKISALENRLQQSSKEVEELRNKVQVLQSTITEKRQDLIA